MCMPILNRVENIEHIKDTAKQVREILRKIVGPLLITEIWMRKKSHEIPAFSKDLLHLNLLNKLSKT